MSYCRFLDSDAYIYDDVNYGLYCMGCSLMPTKTEYSAFFEENMTFHDSFSAGYDYDKMLAHIAEHRQKGDFIPEYADERLRFERDCNHELKNTLNSQTCKICGRWWENDT